MVGNLVRQEIIKRIVNDNLIENADIAHCVGPVSYELRVGSYHERIIDRRIALSSEDKLPIPPNGFVLIGALERVNIPFDIVGMMYLRSTYARKGFLPWFQGIVDPGYQGGLTIVLHNMTTEPIIVTGGERICHLVLDSLPEAVDRGYEGIYQGSEGATPPVQPPAKVRENKMSDAPVGFSPELSKIMLEEMKKNPEQFLHQVLSWLEKR